MTQQVAAEGREARLESCVLRAKVLCDLAKAARSPGERRRYLDVAAEALSEVSHNPALFYVAMITEHSMPLFGISEKELRERAKGVIKGISGEQVRRFQENYLGFFENCAANLPRACRHLEDMYGDVKSVLERRTEELIAAVKEIQGSDERMEKLLEAQVAQMKYLMTTMGKPGPY